MLKRIRSIPFEVVLIVLVILANGYVVFSPANSLMNWYTTDDAFYYYKTAQNFTEGFGLSFDRIGRSSGFHPLWMMVCIPLFALARFDLVLPLRLLVIVSVLLNAGTAVFLYRIMKRALSENAAVLLSLFWAFSPAVHSVTTMLGMESGISAFFVAWLMYLTVCRDQHQPDGSSGKIPSLTKISIIATLAILSRLDNIFVAVFVGLWLILELPSLRYLLFSDALLAAASVFVSFFLRLGFQENYGQYLLAAEAMVVLALVVRPVINYAAGLYGRPANEPIWRQLLRMAAAVTAGSVLLAVVMLSLNAFNLFGGFPRTVLVLDWALSLAGVFAVRLAYLLLSHSSRPLPPADARASLRRMWKSWLNSALAYGLIPAATLAVYMALNRWYFGVWTPVSGTIKHWWGTLFTVYGRPVDSIAAFFGFPEKINGSPWGLATWIQGSITESIMLKMRSEDDVLYNNLMFWFGSAVTIIALVLLISNWDQVRRNFDRLSLMPLFAGCLAQIMQYNGTNYANTRVWYWVTEMMLITFCAALLVEGLFRILDKWRLSSTTLQGFTAVFSAWLVVGFVINLMQLVPPVAYRWNREDYLGGPRALEAATEPGSLIGSTGGGVIAYFVQDRTVVNLDGLMNSAEYFRMLQDRRASEYLDRIGLKYVYGNEYMVTESEPYFVIFKDRLKNLGNVGGSTLFRYLPPK